MFYLLLAIVSAFGLGYLFYRRFRMNRFSDRTVVTEDVIPIPHEEVTSEKAEVLTKTIPLDDHLEVKELFRRAESFFLANAFDDAEKLYVQILSLNPYHEESHARLGLIYLKKGLSTKAEAVYLKLLGLRPENASYQSNLALALYMQRRFEEARDAYVKAIELDPGRAQRYINLAYVYRDLERFEEAIAALEKALALDPNENEYHLVLADLYTDMKRLNEAKTILQNILQREDRKSPLRPAARVMLRKIEKITD